MGLLLRWLRLVVGGARVWVEAPVVLLPLLLVLWVVLLRLRLLLLKLLLLRLLLVVIRLCSLGWLGLPCKGQPDSCCCPWRGAWRRPGVGCGRERRLPSCGAGALVVVVTFLGRVVPVGLPICRIGCHAS